MKFLISGGGTGGHIFPAISIANALREVEPNCEILFVGANGRMEMERIPDAGYNIVGLDIQGLERKKICKNFKVVFNFIKSYIKAKSIVHNFAPDVAIGVGGYVSAAAMRAAASLNVTIVLQEQNSFAGITNKFLAKKASKICVAYDGMERFFEKSKIVLTGNPVRQNILNSNINIKEAYEHFRLDSSKKTLLIIGGSLGAKTINESILGNIDELLKSDFQVIWQTGKYYFPEIAKNLKERYNQSSKTEQSPLCIENLFVADFISAMDYAYRIADVVISRAGASSISELCLLAKPSILVPSPNVSENHQYHNAMSLANKNATILVEDHMAEQILTKQAIDLIQDDNRLKILSENIQKLAFADSAKKIAQVVLQQAKRKNIK
ncbi:UDP-diphospho-muramoylpentapeptide beta-N-acetylglucosaminyltransferase [Porphyromonadaceae bacterium COT-184 OH4590]|nr:UDP-diphospho-muramoylpentapeptide beta-N-acetylglucosaminyltransferase [Porphyromonadaceae bacterium COT-184 OH4590]